MASARPARPPPIMAIVKGFVGVDWGEEKEGEEEGGVDVVADVVELIVEVSQYLVVGQDVDSRGEVQSKRTEKCRL